MKAKEILKSAIKGTVYSILLSTAFCLYLKISFVILMIGTAWGLYGVTAAAILCIFILSLAAASLEHFFKNFRVE